VLLTLEREVGTIDADLGPLDGQPRFYRGDVASGITRSVMSTGPPNEKGPAVGWGNGWPLLSVPRRDECGHRENCIAAPRGIKAVLYATGLLESIPAANKKGLDRQNNGKGADCGGPAVPIGRRASRTRAMPDRNVPPQVAGTILMVRPGAVAATKPGRSRGP
jgi:hypothetical protein